MDENNITSPSLPSLPPFYANDNYFIQLKGNNFYNKAKFISEDITPQDLWLLDKTKKLYEEIRIDKHYIGKNLPQFNEIYYYVNKYILEFDFFFNDDEFKIGKKETLIEELKNKYISMVKDAKTNTYEIFYEFLKIYFGEIFDSIKSKLNEKKITNDEKNYKIITNVKDESLIKDPSGKYPKTLDKFISVKNFNKSELSENDKLFVSKSKMYNLPNRDIFEDLKNINFDYRRNVKTKSSAIDKNDELSQLLETLKRRGDKDKSKQIYNFEETPMYEHYITKGVIFYYKKILDQLKDDITNKKDLKENSIQIFIYQIIFENLYNKIVEKDDDVIYFKYLNHYFPPYSQFFTLFYVEMKQILDEIKLKDETQQVTMFCNINDNIRAVKSTYEDIDDSKKINIIKKIAGVELYGQNVNTIIQNYSKVKKKRIFQMKEKDASDNTSYDTLQITLKTDNKECMPPNNEIKFNKIFDTINQTVMSSYMAISNLIQAGQGIMFFTFGYSGVGKSYTLLGDNKTPGLLGAIVNSIDGVQSMDVRIYELYGLGLHETSENYWSTTDLAKKVIFHKLNKYDNEYSVDDEVEIFDTQEEGDTTNGIKLEITKDNLNEFFNDLSKENGIADKVDNKRKEGYKIFDNNIIKTIKPTANNPDSSRSILVYEFYIKKNKKKIPFIIVDLPGREDVIGSYNLPINSDLNLEIGKMATKIRKNENENKLETYIDDNFGSIINNYDFKISNYNESRDMNIEAQYLKINNYETSKQLYTLNKVNSNVNVEIEINKNSKYGEKTYEIIRKISDTNVGNNDKYFKLNEIKTYDFPSDFKAKNLDFTKKKESDNENYTSESTLNSHLKNIKQHINAKIRKDLNSQTISIFDNRIKLSKGENIIFPSTLGKNSTDEVSTKYYISVDERIFTRGNIKLEEISKRDGDWDFSIKIKTYNNIENNFNLSKENYDTRNKGLKSKFGGTFFGITPNDNNNNNIIVYYKIKYVDNSITEELNKNSNMSQLKKYFKNYNNISQLPILLDNTINENIKEEKDKNMFTKSLEGIYINENINSIMNLLLNKRKIIDNLIKTANISNEYDTSNIYYKNSSISEYDDTVFYTNFYKYYENKAQEEDNYAPITNLCAFFVLANISKNEIIQKKLKENVGIETVPVAVPKPVQVQEPEQAPEQAPKPVQKPEQEQVPESVPSSRGRPPVGRRTPSPARRAQKQQYEYKNEEKIIEVLNYLFKLRKSLNNYLKISRSQIININILKNNFIKGDLQELLDNEYNVLYDIERLKTILEDKIFKKPNKPDDKDIRELDNFKTKIISNIPTNITKIKEKVKNNKISNYLILLDEFLTTSGDNYLINKNEYIILLNKTLLNAGIKKPISEAVAEREFQKANTDKSGQLSFLEYLNVSIEELKKYRITREKVMSGGEEGDGGEEGEEDEEGEEKYIRSNYENQMCKTQIGMLKDFEQIINKIVTKTNK